MKKYLLSTFAIVALLFAACGGDDGVSTTVPVSGIKLDKSSLSLEIGEKATLTATIAPSDATNKSITWSSANQNIATVNNGVVSGVAAGETTITAKTNDGGFTASATVKVTPEAVKVTQIKLVGVPTEAKEGRSTTFSAVITPTDATDMTVTFTSSNPEVATVEYTKTEDNYSLALLKAVSPGKTKITATANDGSGVKAEAEVTVIPTVKVSEISLVVSKSEVTVGYMVRATATISPENAENKEVTWSSSDTKIARVQAVAGKNNAVDVIGVSEGWVTITATAKDGSGVTGEKEILVLEPIMVEFVVIETPSKDKIAVGETLQLVGEAYPNEAPNRTLEWISSNPAVATVSSSGLVKGVAEGKVTITAKSTDGTNKEDSVEIQVFEGAMPTSLTFSDETLTGWHGKVFEATPTQIVPSNGNLKALNWGSYYDTRDEVDIVVERSKVKFSLVEQTHGGSSGPNQFGIQTYAGQREVIMARVATQMFLFKSLDSNGKPKAQLGVDYLEYLYESKERLDAGNYYFAAYWKDGKPGTGSYYNYVNSCTDNDFIPATEYTLTSSHPNKWKVTRVNKYVWKIEDLDPTTYQELTITYKCNKWERIMTFQVIPQ